MSAELAESYAVLEQRVQEKTAGLEHKNQILSFLWQANRRLHSRAPLCERLSPVLNDLQNLPCYVISNCGCMTLMMKRIIGSLPASQI